MTPSPSPCRAAVFAVLTGAVVCAAPAAQRAVDDALEIPFAFEHNEIVVRATIDQKGPYQMLVDTDSNPSVISAPLARSIGLPLRTVGQQVTGGGADRPEVFVTKLTRVALGALPPKDLQAIAIDLDQIGSRVGTAIDGVLGHNFLGGTVLEIDYANRLLRFRKAPRLSSAPTARLPFRYDDQSSSLVVDGVTVNGRKVAATIDTGSDGTFKLTPAAVDELGLTDAVRNGTPQASGGYNGAAQNTLGRVDDIAIGGVHLRAVDVVFFGKGTGRDRKPWRVNIGNGFLRDYVVTIDYPRKLIVLEKQSPG